MQNGVSLSTNESDLEIVYGPVKVSERELARTSVKYIFSDLNDIKKNYFRLGFHLFEFESNSYYFDFGYYSFSDFVEANLSMDKSAASRCINVFRAFCLKQNGCFTYCIDDKYSDYSYSQLCEMLPMSDVDRGKVTPEMSVKQIREFKKNVSQKKENVSHVATSQSINKKPKKDLSKVATLHGSALQSFVKSLSLMDLADNKSLVLYLFDADGKPLPFEYGFNSWGKELYHDTKDGSNCLYVKLHCRFPKDKEGVAHD